MRSEENPPASGSRGSREDMFEELVKLHRRELTRFAVRQLGEHASLAEDVVQEALPDAHRAIAAGTCPEHPRAWLFTITRNAAVNAARGARTTDEIEERRHCTAAQSVPAAVEQSEWLDWLMGAVGELPARQRDALVGHAFEGRSYREIAARHLPTEALEYTECARELRFAELRAAARRPRRPADSRRRRHHRPGPSAR
jgi:RNA polymerase sigma factor (sigma-70 family)